jgi:hypothetical protein
MRDDIRAYQLYIGASSVGFTSANSDDYNNNEEAVCDAGFLCSRNLLIYTAFCVPGERCGTGHGTKIRVQCSGLGDGVGVKSTRITCPTLLFLFRVPCLAACLFKVTPKKFAFFSSEFGAPS